MNSIPLPDIQILNRFITYNPITGDILYVKSKKKVSYKTNRGYLRCSIERKQYSAHRVAYKIFYNIDPLVIDHINGDRSDNRILNLRNTTTIDNCRNQTKQINNTSGVVGVYFHKKHQKWTAIICVKYKLINLGVFENKEDAIMARKKAEYTYGFNKGHGKEKINIYPVFKCKN